MTDVSSSWVDSLGLDDIQQMRARTAVLEASEGLTGAEDLDPVVRAFVLRVAVDGQFFLDHLADSVRSNKELVTASLLNHNDLDNLYSGGLAHIKSVRDVVTRGRDFLGQLWSDALGPLSKHLDVCIEQITVEAISLEVQFGTRRPIPVAEPVRFRKK